MEDARPPQWIGALVGASWMALTLSALVATMLGFYNLERHEGQWVAAVLALRLVGVVTGLPAVIYMFRTNPEETE